MEGVDPEDSSDTIAPNAFDERRMASAHSCESERFESAASAESRARPPPCIRYSLGFIVWGVGCGAKGVGCRVKGVKCRLKGVGCRVSLPIVARARGSRELRALSLSHAPPPASVACLSDCPDQRSKSLQNCNPDALQSNETRCER